MYVFGDCKRFLRIHRMFTVMQSTFIPNCLRQWNFGLHVSGYCIPYQLQSRFLTIHCKAGFVKVKKCLRQQLKLWQALKISFYYNISVFQCFHIFHITYYHECNLECNGIFKNTEIKTCTLLEFIEAIDQSVSMDVKLSGCL